ncbi:MAG TPA: hypothetical protein VGD37_12020 [Kofleriaceae bacterium]|jgi:hypothetical protein
MRTAIICGLVTFIGCSTSVPVSELPLISPPVRAATPSGLRAAAARWTGSATVDMLRASDLRERFFHAGPTDLMAILGSIDQRLAEVNSADQHPACLDQVPVAYTITPFGHEHELTAQCYRRFSPSAAADDGFLQFGERDGTISLYVAVGAARLAAVVTPIAGSTDHVVDAWYGVGYTNATGCGTSGTFDDCSYAVTQLHADPATKAFEMSVAGIGVGFCGVQFASDGTVLYGVGSTDMGEQCNAPATLCVSAGDLDAAATCGAPDYHLPALGRHAGAGAHTFGASQYPDAPNITLDGTASDSLHFGPTGPTSGAGDFDAR